MPGYPGTPAPIIKSVSSIDKDGYNEKSLFFYSHAGTHVDVPSHIIKNSKNINQYPPDKFYGSALKLTHNFQIPLNIETIKLKISEFGIPDFILLYTGWDKFWGSDNYYSSFPTPDINVVKYLSGLNLKGVGIDSLSIDPIETNELNNHKLLLEAEIIIIENLTKISRLPESIFEFFCFPLNIKDGDASPVRAIAKL